MQNLGSFHPLGVILGAPSHTKLDFAILLYPLFVQVNKLKLLSLHTFTFICLLFQHVCNSIWFINKITLGLWNVQIRFTCIFESWLWSITSPSLYPHLQFGISMFIDIWFNSTQHPQFTQGIYNAKENICFVKRIFAYWPILAKVTVNMASNTGNLIQYLEIGKSIG